jgi:hypothetical protein
MFGKDKTFSADGTKVMLTSQNGSYNYWVEINTLTCYWEHQSEKCLVITDWSEGQCHICGVNIQGAVFERTGERWVLSIFNPQIVLLGSFGFVSKGELIRIGDDKHAIVFRSGYGNLGHFFDYVTFIAETENSLGVVFQYDSSVSDTDGWKYVAQLDFNPDKTNPDYYKIVLSYFGTDSNGDTPPTQMYVFSRTKYVLPGPTPTFVPSPTSTPRPTFTPGPSPTPKPTTRPVITVPELKVISEGNRTTIENFNWDVSSLHWSEDGKRLIIGPQLNQMYIFNVENKSLSIIPLEVPAPSSSKLISSKKTLAVTLCNTAVDEATLGVLCDKNDWSIYFIDLETGNLVKTIPLPAIDGPDFPLGQLIISPDGKMLIDRNETELGLWDITNGRKIKTLFTNGSQMFISGVALSPDSKFLVAKGYTSNSPKQTFMVWNTSTWELQRTFSGANLGVQGFALSFSPNGNRFVTDGGAGIYDLSVWDFNTGKMLLSLGTPKGIYASAYDPYGKHFAVSYISYDNPNWDVITFYEAGTGKVIRKLDNGCLVISVLAFNPDGTKLAAGGGCDRPGEVKIWDLSQP